jgi:hypothetical protein
LKTLAATDVHGRIDLLGGSERQSAGDEGQ